MSYIISSLLWDVEPNGRGPFRPPRHPPGPTDRSQTSRPGQDHHHSLDRNTDTADSTRDSRGGSKKVSL
ncbi:hypothetical protein N7501_000430 [Penicillium viridicatum]|nr:hypothetical protein N7501_000430 [Penicillium viridicatum]